MGIEFAKDLLLIALCGASAFYCWMLSQRLKRLNDLKSGVGASIVTLTEAIERTHAAAATARSELRESIEEMKGLLSEADGKSKRLEAAMGDADGRIVDAEQAAKTLQEMIEIEVPGARRKALKTTEALLKVMADMKRMNAALPRIVATQPQAGLKTSAPASGAQTIATQTSAAAAETARKDVA